MKVKKGEIVPNQEQLIKIASKTAIELEIQDVTQYLEMFKDCEKEQIKKDIESNKQHLKEINKVKSQALKLFADVLSLHAISESKNNLPDQV